MTIQGTVESDDYLNPNDPMAAPLLRAAQAEDAAAKACVADKGTLGLPECLDEVRIEFGIPDAAFKVQAAFDRCLVWQFSGHAGQTFTPGGLLLMPDTVATRERNETPRGILVSAGLTALDQIRSHGIELGDIVIMMKLAPYHMPIGFVAGVQRHLVVLAAGDIVGSESLAVRMKEKKASIQVHSYPDPVTGAMVRIHTMAGLQPANPKMDPDL